MSDRFRNRSGDRKPGSPRGNRAAAAPRYTSRRQKETMYQRFFYIGLVAAAVVIVAILGFGAFYEYQIKPNQVIASVNGQEITRKEYWKYQSVALYNQARMYEEYALQTTGQQQTQFLTYAASFDEMRGDVWGSTDVSDATVSQMVEDRLYIAGAEDLGIDLSGPVLSEYALNGYAPADQPLVTPIPSPTMIPERAEWATQTAEALATQQSVAMGTPAATPGAAPITAGATPVATPSDATPVGTPDMARAVSTAEAGYDLFQEDVFDDARLDEEEYLELIVKPQYARDQVNSRLINDVPQRTEQVQVQHILVATEELANQTYEQVTGGANFDEVAKTTSTDTITAPTGGQLGWITHQQMPEAFTEAAFSTEPGQVAQPVNTEYGWHIIKVLDKDPERPMTETQYTEATEAAISDWLDQQREAADISSDHYEPTPEPTAEQFLPPADAPTPVVATPIAAPDLSATPISGPDFVGPTASPVASPGASPVASPAP